MCAAQTQRELERALRARTSCPPVLTYFYEDLVDGAVGATALWRRVLQTLGVRSTSNGDSAAADGTRLRIIHGSQRTLHTVANPDEVKRALSGTPHDWMLRD